MPAMTPTAGGAQRRRRPGSPAASSAGAKPVASASATRPDAGSPRREEGRTSSPVSSTDRALAEIDALAFATDPASERALREGLAGCRDGQVWPGGLRTAAAALGQGQSPRILFVDLDETPYPAGAIHELAAVCEVGTVVIALGSDDSARSSREILLAAERGRYVSVLDLNRTFSALSFLLDVEPGGGLVDLLSTVARASLHPDMVDGMRAVRSDRIAVYGYPWSVESPPLAPVWAVCELLVELQRRSHLVIVDGMDDPATRQTLLAMVDARVLVVEPTATGAASAVRMMARLGPMLDHDWPFVLVQNHTREFKARAGAQTLGRAGVAAAPDVVVPFEPTLPAVTDRGWPQGRLPRTLREPLAGLTDRILASAGIQETMTAGPDSAGAQVAAHASPAPAGRSRSSPGSSARPGPSAVRRALRRLLPLGTARPRAA